MKRTVPQPFSPGRMGLQKLGDVEGSLMDRWAAGMDTFAEQKRRIRSALVTLATNAATPIYTSDEIGLNRSRKVYAEVSGISLDGLSAWSFLQWAHFGRGNGAAYLVGSGIVHSVGPAGPSVTIALAGSVPTVSVDDNGAYSITWNAYLEEMETRTP